MMNMAVAKCLIINLNILGGSDNKFSLVWHNYFNCYYRQRLGPAKEAFDEAHNLFDLTSANEWCIPLSRYVEMDIKLFYLKLVRAWFLVIKNPSDLLDPKHSTKLPRIVGYNFIKLVHQEFIKQHNTKVFEKLNVQKEWIIYYLHIYMPIIMPM